MQWTAFPLHPETPLSGRRLDDMFQGRGIDIPAMIQRLAGVAKDLGLPFGRREMTFNSRRAQELGKWAETQNRGEEYHHAVFHTYFANGRNISEIPVLTNLAREIGLNPDKAREVIENSSFHKAVDLDWQRSREMGITAVPSFFFGGRLLVGAFPYQDLARFVEKGGARVRKTG